MRRTVSLMVASLANWAVPMLVAPDTTSSTRNALKAVFLTVFISSSSFAPVGDCQQACQRSRDEYAAFARNLWRGRHDIVRFGEVNVWVGVNRFNRWNQSRLRRGQCDPGHLPRRRPG